MFNIGIEIARQRPPTNATRNLASIKSAGTLACASTAAKLDFLRSAAIILVLAIGPALSKPFDWRNNASMATLSTDVAPAGVTPAPSIAAPGATLAQALQAAAVEPKLVRAPPIGFTRRPAAHGGRADRLQGRVPRR